MKRILLFLSVALLLCSGSALAQSMSDSQVAEFIKREVQAGTSQSQIVTKLVQRGVNVDQIRRVRAQYDRQIKNKGLTGAADAAVEETGSRLRSEKGDETQDLTVGKMGAQAAVAVEADEHYATVRQNVNNDYQAGSQELRNTQVFGRDIFNKELLSFEPNMNIPTPIDYVLGPGDVLIIDIYGASQKTYQLTVSPEGAVTVPGYGPVQVAGLTVAAAQSRVRSGLGSRYSTSDLKVSVGQTRTILINVMGEVKAPGTYHLSAFASVFHALYMAGGISELGTLRNIRVIRE